MRLIMENSERQVSEQRINNNEGFVNAASYSATQRLVSWRSFNFLARFWNVARSDRHFRLGEVQGPRTSFRDSPRTQLGQLGGNGKTASQFPPIVAPIASAFPSQPFRATRPHSLEL